MIDDLVDVECCAGRKRIEVAVQFREKFTGIFLRVLVDFILSVLNVLFRGVELFHSIDRPSFFFLPTPILILDLSLRLPGPRDSFIFIGQIAFYCCGHAYLQGEKPYFQYDKVYRELLFQKLDKERFLTGLKREM